MSEKDSLSPREQKRLADAQTPYLTFLPRQAEGFDPGLHTQTGILTDGGWRTSPCTWTPWGRRKPPSPFPTPWPWSR